jgi:uncharacterized membrane protein YccF (DUF307 family)
VERPDVGENADMRLLLNLIWLVFSGFWLAIGYVLTGVVMVLLIITIPFGIAAFRLAGFVIWPFGRTVVPKPSAGAGSAIGNVLWFLLAGLWLAIVHVVTAIALAITIIGIPLALGNLKLAWVALAPLGKDVVPVDDPRAAGGITI